MFIDGIALARLEQQAVSIGFSSSRAFEPQRVLSAGDHKGFSYVTAVFFEEEHASQWVVWAHENLDSVSAEGVYTEVSRVGADNPVTDIEAYVAVVCAYDLVLKDGPQEGDMVDGATIEDIVVALTRLHAEGKLEWEVVGPQVKTAVDDYRFFIAPHYGTGLRTMMIQTPTWSESFAGPTALDRLTAAVRPDPRLQEVLNHLKAQE